LNRYWVAIHTPFILTDMCGPNTLLMGIAYERSTYYGEVGVMLLTAYREFESRVGSVETAKGAKASMVLAAIERLPVRFTIGDVAKKCPTVGLHVLI